MSGVPPPCPRSHHIGQQRGQTEGLAFGGREGGRFVEPRSSRRSMPRRADPEDAIADLLSTMKIRAASATRRSTPSSSPAICSGSWKGSWRGSGRNPARSRPPRSLLIYMGATHATAASPAPSRMQCAPPSIRACSTIPCGSGRGSFRQCSPRRRLRRSCRCVK
jgi:hypothetical protein